MRTIAVVNLKGGSGKTTTALALAVGCARRKKRVLLIDADPQAAAVVLTLDDRVDEMNNAAFYALSTLIKNSPALTPQALNAMMIARNLERVGDHATNIAEILHFEITGAPIMEQRPKTDSLEPHDP